MKHKVYDKYTPAVVMDYDNLNIDVFTCKNKKKCSNYSNIYFINIKLDVGLCSYKQRTRKE